MARGEVSVTCPHCGFLTRLPAAALQRNNHHCSRCGVHIPLGGVKADLTDESQRPGRARPKRPYRPTRRR